MTRDKNALWQRVINIFLNLLIGIFGIFLLISIYNNIQIHVLGNDYSSFFGYSMFEVQTGSMSPTIKAGDMILVKNVPEIKVDDVITYKEDGEFITHRVKEIYRETLVTQGDANNSLDNPIIKEQVVGKVISIFPYFGTIRSIFFNPFVLLTLIFTLYLISSMFRRGKNMKVKEFLLKVVNFLKDKLEKEEKTNVQTNEVPVKEEPIVLKEENVVVNKVSSEETAPDTILTENAKEILANTSSEDLDKTIYFRMVAVDKKDVAADSKPKENEEVEEEILEVEEKPKVKEEKESEEPLDKEVKLKLELLQKRKKKCKNIIEKVMLLKVEELEEIVKELNLNQEYKTNEPTIKEYFMKVYIDGKYYNYCGDVNVSYDAKNMVSRLEKLMLDTGKALKKGYKGKDVKFNEKVEKFTKIFLLLPAMEKANSSKEMRTKRETFKKKIYAMFKDEYMSLEEAGRVAEKIIKIQKVYESARTYLYSKLVTNTFKIKYAKVKDQKIYGVDLAHNINFSKIYSEYIVDKTYQEGIVAEDKVFVLANMLLTEISKDMLDSDFSKEYLLYIPDSLYEKEVKLNQLIDILNDEYVKHSTTILLKYKEIEGKKTLVKTLMKEGFSFALSLEKEDVVKEKDLKFFYLMKYILINEKKETSKIIKKLPKDLKNRCLFDDVASKIAKNGGEE